MTTATIDAPTATAPAASQAGTNPAATSIESIAAKMAAMRQQTERNLMRQDEATAATGDSAQANSETPVAPDAADSAVEPEIATTTQTIDTEPEEVQAHDESVSEDATTDTTSNEIIDFIEFAESNPDAKFKFIRNGKEMIIDAKKAAAILGQGGAIHEEARQLKIQKAEFDEYQKEAKAKTEGLLLAMEFTVQPQLQSAYDEIVKTQGYQATFQQQLAQTHDPAQQARIRASMQQNERYIEQQSAVIRQLKPQVDQFYKIRSEQVQSVLENNRKQFQDKELRNEFVYKEIRDKLSKSWTDAQGELIPGIKNVDLISSDEFILGLIRDGLKFRDRPSGKSAGASIAQLQTRKGASVASRGQDEQISTLREQAKKGDRKAADNLLVARLNQIRGNRGVK